MKKTKDNKKIRKECFGIFLILLGIFLTPFSGVAICGAREHVKSNLKTSTLIREDSSCFLDGILENLTISVENNLILEETFPLDAEWATLTPSIRPSARRWHSMVYDSEHGKVVLFGGWDDGGYDDETWMYDLETNEWTNMTTSTKPSARVYHEMVYDSEHGKVILFGGDDGIRDDETWVYDIDMNSWTNMTTSTKPSAREWHSMVYDSEHGKVVLFGGWDDGSYDDETWTYELETNMWTNMTTSTKPSARRRHAMAYDSEHCKVIMFGGYVNGTNNDETWAYDLDTNVWTNLNPSTKPSARRDHKMVFDSKRGKVVLFGGYNETSDDEIWTYDLEANNWTNLNPSIKPTPRYGHDISYDSKQGKVVLFGGWTGINDDETWALGFKLYHAGRLRSKIVNLYDIYEISGGISWSPENQTMGTNLTFQVGFSNTTSEEDFIYTSQHDSSFIFEGIGCYFRYSAWFESDINLRYSSILESVEIFLVVNDISSNEDDDDSGSVNGFSFNNLFIIVSIAFGVVGTIGISAFIVKKRK